MGVGVPTWEERLEGWAREGLESGKRHDALRVEPRLLADAYRRCADIAREHSHTFYIASGLLPLSKRRATRALYAFCRISDDIVDIADGDRHETLDAWRECVTRPDPPLNRPVALAWADTRACFGIPLRYAEQLLEGVAQDLTKTRYETFNDLANYCYGVASTVGLMAMHITGFSGPEAIPYAVKLGVALQLTNILRDIGEDWRAGRLYLPADELADYGLSEGDIAAGAVNARWRKFLSEQVERTQALYREALPGIALLHRSGRFAIAAAAELYRGILDNIMAYGGDVFCRRAHLTDAEKLMRLPGIWWRVTTGQYGRA